MDSASPIEEMEMGEYLTDAIGAGYNYREDNSN